MLRHLVVAMVVLTTACPAIAYEAELSALAGKLARKLEESGSKSGTVLDFTDLQGSPTELGRFLAQETSDQLVARSKAFSLVDRANLQHLMREHKLSVEGLVNPESSRKLGNLIGIDTIIVGTTTPLDSNIRLSVRAIAVESGKIIASETTSLQMTESLRALYSRGVAGSGNAGGISQDGTSAGEQQVLSTRSSLRQDTFRFQAKEIAVRYYSGSGSEQAVITFSLENLSGSGVGIGLLNDNASAGSCVGRISAVSGIRLYSGFDAVKS